MSEHSTQVAFAEWCKWNEAKHPELQLAFAVPNGGKRHVWTAMKLKAEGVRAGVLDWCMPVPIGGYNGLWIEFKFGKNKLTDDQEKYAKLLEQYGHCVAVCYTVDEAIRVTLEYLNPPHHMNIYP